MARELVGEMRSPPFSMRLSPCNRGHPGVGTIQVLSRARFRGDGEHSAVRYSVGGKRRRDDVNISAMVPSFQMQRPPKLYYRFGRWRVVAVSAWRVVRAILVRSLAPARCSMAAPLKHQKQIGHFLETLSSRSLNFGSSAAINSPRSCGVRHSVLFCTPTCQVGNARVSRPSFTRSPSLFGALFRCMDLPFPTRLSRPSRATSGLKVGPVQQLAAVVALPPIVPPCWALHSPTAALEGTVITRIPGSRALVGENARLN